MEFQTPGFINADAAKDSERAKKTRNLTPEDQLKLIHPDDASAIAALKAVPGISQLVGYASAQTIEKMLYDEKLASCLRLGSKQLPEIYNLLTPICEKFGMTEIPDLFVELAALPNAYTFGDKRKFIVVTSGALEAFTHEEIQLVLAHECGHIVCRHSLYTMVASVLGYGLNWIPANLSGLLQLPFYRWRRMSELSADRAMLLFAGNVDRAARLLVRLSCGGSRVVEKVNMEAFREQANEFNNRVRDAKVESAMQSVLIAYMSHPFISTRVQELAKWGESSAFVYLSSALGTLNRRCPTCGAILRGTSRICECGRLC